MAFRELSTTGATSPYQSLSSDGIIGGPAAALRVALVDPIVVGDDGGWALNLTGVFPTHRDYIVEIIRDGEDFDAQRCYSGKVGDDDRCSPTHVAKLVCYVPPLPIGDNYDIRVYSTDGLVSTVALNMFKVVHRSFVTNLYTMRSHFPLPRDVGAYSIDDED